MLEEFLNKQLETLKDNKDGVQELISNENDTLKEEQKFLDVLRKDAEDVFTEFSPRDLNHKYGEKIQETEDKIKASQERIKVLHNDLQEIDHRIDELKAVILESKHLLHAPETLSTLNDKECISLAEDEKKEQRYVSCDPLLDMLTEIDTYILSDPMRAKLALIDMKHFINK